jgi:hypothetical protein
MIVGVALFASLVYGSVQQSRIAYIAVRTDKDVYTSAEDVTFKLMPLTEGIQFTLSGWMDPNYNGVHVIRIPDDVDPAEVVTNTSLLDRFRSWDRGYANLPIETFNSTGEPLEMSWNGTIRVANELVNDLETEPSNIYYKWANATSGYYLLYPRLQWSYGHVTKFLLDDSAVFYYDSLDVNISTVHDISTVDGDYSFSMSLDISLGEGMPEGEYQLRSLLYQMKWDAKSVSTYLNETFVLTTGGKPVHLELGPMDAGQRLQATYDAVVIGPDGKRYAFGFEKSSGGGWNNDYRY